MQKTKKLISLLIVLCMLTVFVPMPMAYADGMFSGGSGTENDPYLIANAADFKKLATEVNGGNDYKGTYFKIPDTVTETIELSTEDGYVPIGNDANQFEGTFDGGNHTVNLNLTGERLVGLFGEGGENSNLCNIRTTGSVSMTGYYAGGIVANMYGSVVNCHNEASVTGIYHVGGIVGLSDNSKYVINCSNSGAIDGILNVGGIVGNISTMKVINCLNTGMVQGNSCGGIAGDSGIYGKIYNCINNGLVTKKSDGNYIGGLFGEKNGNNDAFGNCYYNGTINSEIGDFGHLTNNSEHYTVRDFAKTSEEIVSEDVLNNLNVYVRDNKPNDTQLLYWKVVDGNFAFTEEKPNLPYTITNNQPNYITVAQSALANESVEINTDKVPAYLKLTKITVNDNEIKANSDGKYIFTMPENDVTIAAEVEVNLEKNSNNEYVISTDEELTFLAKAVNNGFEIRNVVLAADVKASTAKGFEPIGTKDKPYKGNFDGNGHTITLSVTSGIAYDDTAATGLFGVTSNAYIRNLIIKGSVDGGADTSSYTGAFVGVMSDYNGLYNVYSEASVSGSGFVGGLVGYSAKNVTAYNAVMNGTVTQKNTADDKKKVGTIIGKGSCNTGYIYYNSEKNSGVFYAGYNSNGNEITADRNSNMAKTTAELFSNDTMDSLNIISKYYNYLYWDFVAEGGFQTVKMSEKCPVPVYDIITDNKDIIRTSYYSRAGKTVAIEIDLSNDDKNMVNSVKEIKVTDSKGNSVNVTKTGEDKYEFVMPKSDVNILAVCDYNLTKDSDGVYYISDIDDLFAFAQLVEQGQTDANAKVVGKNIDYTDYNGYLEYESIGLIGRNAPYTGTFDGNGANIKLNSALFGETDGAVIKNVNMEVSTDAAKTAGIVRTANNTRIDNCDVNIEVMGYGGIYGGVAAEAYNSTITNCIVTAQGSVYEFGGIAYSTSGNTVIANSVLRNSSVNVSNVYGGIVAYAYGKTKIYNCANNDAVFNADDGASGIVAYAELSGLTLENNLYNEKRGYYDVYYDIENGQEMLAMTDKNSEVSNEDNEGLYIPAKLNEYAEANSDSIEGVTLKKWSIDDNYELCFADGKYKEIYLINQSGVKANTLVDESYIRGAFSGVEVTIAQPPANAKVTVTDADGNNIELAKNENGYVFTMPESCVTVSVVMDTGISETTEIDGKTYAVVKTADDFIKAVKSIADGNNSLNVYIAEDIELTAENLAEYPQYTEDTVVYYGIFDGAGHTVTFNGLKQAMLYAIGQDGIVKNITVDGTVSSVKSESGEGTSETELKAASIAISNAGQILNCINKADISGVKAAGIASYNGGNVFNCINKGDITGSMSAAAITGQNKEMVMSAANEGKITDNSGNTSRDIMTGDGYSGTYAKDFSAVTDFSKWTEFASTVNAIAEEIEKMNNEAKKPINVSRWSVLKSETSTEFVFADGENMPYYIFMNNGAYQMYKEGDTVEFTVDTSDFEEGIVISDITVKTETDKLNVSPVEGKENTFSFIMPGRICSLVVKTETEGVEKDENGYYLVGTLDDLKKVKQTIELGNNNINIKLTANIEGYDGTPIGDDYGYSGKFDGDGHSITLAMNDETERYSYYGLFGKLNKDAVVKNLTINGTARASADYMGAIAGLCDGTVINCVNNANVTNVYNYGVAGGIGGYTDGSKYNFTKITDCTNNGKIDAENVAGGILGIGGHVEITNCVNNAQVNANGNASGIANAQDGKGDIINCANNGSVVSSNGNAAGILISGGTMTVKNCFNSENVSGLQGSYAIACYYGVDISDNIDDARISNSFYVQTADINHEIASSNLAFKNDSSKAVTESDTVYVSAMLNSGVTYGMNYWTVKNGKVVFADGESELYYAIEIDKNIKGGTVIADKKFAKAGEKITLTITPEKDGQLPIITGVELDENNSFVMPDRGVKINAVFGDTFTGTEKSDVIELDENVEMDEIKLADYVKFENDEISREFTFTLADGSVLPDGLKLSYARISGTPTKAGTYTVVFDVTDSGASLMSLEPDKALGNAKLTLTFKVTKVDEVTPIGQYADKISITKKVKDNNVIFTVKPIDGTSDKLASAALFAAEYDNEGNLVNIKIGENENDGEKLIITAGLPETDNYKLMLWDEAKSPMADAITDVN